MNQSNGAVASLRIHPRIVLVKCPYRLCEAGRVRYLSGGRLVDVECWHCGGKGTLAVDGGVAP